jgi:stress response protein SCP2
MPVVPYACGEAAGSGSIPAMTQMTMGGNVAITATALRASLNYAVGAGVPDIDASALLLRADGRVASDADFIFYNQPAHPSGSVRHLGKSPGVDSLEVDLPLVPTDVDRIVLAASADGGTFGQVPDLRLAISDRVSGAELASFAMIATTETAMVGGELYRRGSDWKFRAVGQGYAAGLGGLATDFGIGVDGAAAPAAAPAPAAPEPVAPAPAPAPVAPPAPPPEPVAQPAASSLDLDAPIVVSPPVELPPPPVAPPPPPPVEVAPPPPPPPPPPVEVAPPPPPVEVAPPPSPLPPPPAEAAPPPPPPPAPAAPAAGPGLNLQKDQHVPLAGVGGAALGRVVMAAGWDPAPGRAAIDLDVSAIAFDLSGEELEIVSTRHLAAFLGAVQHTGDNKTGNADGDSERILVELPRLPDNVHALVFTLTSFSGQTFTDLARAYCRLVDADSNVELVRFDLTDTQPSTAVLMSMLRRTGPGVWGLKAIGEFHDFKTVKHLVSPAARHVKMG